MVGVLSATVIPPANGAACAQLPARCQQIYLNMAKLKNARTALNTCAEQSAGPRHNDGYMICCWAATLTTRRLV
jgi:hypothetical protein